MGAIGSGAIGSGALGSAGSGFSGREDAEKRGGSTGLKVVNEHLSGIVLLNESITGIKIYGMDGEKMALIMKKGDTKPWLVMQILDDYKVVNGVATGTPVDLTEAEKVFAAMRDKTKETGSPKAFGECIFEDRANGIVAYPWVKGDTDTPGDYNVECEVVDNEGGRETFPNVGFGEVKIEKDLGEADES